VSKQHNASTVCLSVRVTHEEAELARAWAATHRVTMQQVLHRCVTAATNTMREVAAPHLVAP